MSDRPRGVIIVNSRSKRPWGWRTPSTPGWLGYAVTARLGIVLVLILSALGVFR